MNSALTNVEAVVRLASVNKVTLSLESIHLLANCIFPKKYKKGELILNEGDDCNHLLFVEKGMTRQFYFKNGKDLTEHIAYEDGVVICLESYIKHEPTRLMIEALEPLVCWLVPREAIERLAGEHFDIALLYRRIFELSLIESQIKADMLRFEPAHERYVKLAQLHPEIVRRAPLVFIASLLQMTPETLSRVRTAVLNG